MLFKGELNLHFIFENHQDISDSRRDDQMNSRYFNNKVELNFFKSDRMTEY